MSELIKIAVTLVVVTVLLIVAAVIVIPFFVDPNDYKPQIAAAVKQHTTREIEIEGDLVLSVFPWLGIETGKISLSNAPGFGDNPFAEIEHTEIKVKLLPLFSKKIEVNRIVVKGLILNLAKNKNGVSNWEDLKSTPKQKSEPNTPKNQINPKSGEKEATLDSLAVAGIALLDANIIWDDRSKSQHVEISDFNFLMARMSFGQPVDFEMEFMLNSKKPHFSEKLDISGNVNVEMNKFFELKNLLIQLGDTTIKGHTKVVDFSSPAIAFNFEIDDIDVDRYFPVKKQKKPENTKTSPSPTPQPTSSSTVPAGKAPEFPLETLRALNIQGKAKISRLTIKGIKAQGVEFNIQGKNGVITSKQSVTKLYGGSYQGNIQIDARKNIPKLTLNESLSNVQVEPLLRDSTGKAPISGTAEFSAQLSGKGLNTDAIKSSLNGTIDALFTDGAIQGINLIGMIRTANKLLKEQSTQSANETDKTEFSEFKLASTVNRGVVNTHELIVKSPLIRVTGSGKVNLVSEAIDYRIVTKLVDSLEGQGGAETKDLKGIPIGVKIGGSLSKPSYRLDLAESLTSEQKEKIEKKKQKLLDKLDKKLGPGTSDFLKKFF